MLTRRSFLAAAAVAVGAGLAGCGSAASGRQTSAGSDAGSAIDRTAGGEAAAEGAASGNVLVAYFSATGHTAGVAAALADHLGADVFEIVPAEPYTDDDLDYNDDSSRVSVEHAEDARPGLAQVTPDDFGGYDTVFLGYPIWWGDAALPAKTFAEGNDFSGKTVVPFCTSASSGIGGSGDALAELAGGGDWLDGERFAAGASDDEVASWADGLAL